MPAETLTIELTAEESDVISERAAAHDSSPAQYVLRTALAAARSETVSPAAAAAQPFETEEEARAFAVAIGEAMLDEAW